MEMTSNWAALFPELLVDITKRLVSEDDFTSFIAFGGVCTSWRFVYVKVKEDIMTPTPSGLGYKSVMLSNKLKGKDKKDVWLMLPDNEEEDDIDNRRFVSFSFNGADDGTDVQGATSSIGKTIMHYIQLPSAARKRCFSFPDGWLLTVGEDYDTNLLHILSGIEIELPGWDTVSDTPLSIYHRFPTIIERAVMIPADPSVSCTNFGVIMLFTSGCLAYATPQDHAWKCISSHLDLPLVSEIYVYKGQVLVMDWCGNIRLCDVNQGHEPTLSLLFHIDPEIGKTLGHYDFRDSHLVESLGELLVIFRRVDWDGYGDIYGTHEFRVFKVDLYSGRWTEMDSLGNRSVFVGKNVSFTIDASELPGCKPDCIYFTQSSSYYFLVDSEDYIQWSSEGNNDMGVYDLKDGCMKPYLSPQCCSLVWPSIWVLPS